jgi:hypothetical protein
LRGGQKVEGASTSLALQTEDGNISDVLTSDLSYLGDVVSSGAFLDTPASSELEAAVASLRARAVQGELQLAILAEANAGKSTFINALLDYDLLPTGIAVGLTAIPTYIRFGTSLTAIITRSDGSEAASSVDELAGYVREGPGAKGVLRVDVMCPASLLEAGLTIVDTPGANVSIAKHREATSRVIDQCNACVFLIDSSRPGTKSTLRFLNEIATSVDKFFFVLSRADILDEDEIAEAVDYLTEILAEECSIRSPRICPVSAREAMKDRTGKHAAQFGDLRDQIVAVLRRDHELLVASQLMDVERGVLELARTQAEQRVALYEAELAKLYQTSFPSLSEFSARMRPETERRVAARFAALRKDLLKRAEGLKPRVRSMILGERSREKLRSDVPRQVEKVVRESQVTYYSTLQGQAASIYRDSIGQVDEAFRQLLEPIRAVEARLLLRSWLPYGLAVAATTAYGLFRVNEGWSVLDPFWTMLVAIGAFLIGLIVQSVRTSFSYQMPNFVQGSATWDNRALSEFRSKNSGSTGDVVAQRVGLLGLQSARAALTGGASLGLETLGVGIVVLGVVAIGAMIWDALFGPSVEAIQKDLLDRVEPGLEKIECAMLHAVNEGLAQYEQACVQLVQEKFRANELKYESVVQALVARSRQTISAVKARRQMLSDIVLELGTRQERLARIRDGLRRELLSRS